MLAPTSHQTSIFYLSFAREAALIKDDLLEEIDLLLDDPQLIDIATNVLAKRRPNSKSMGRTGKISPDQLIRACALKHIKGWSLRELERELRASLLYRRFTHYDGGSIPKYNNFSQAFALLGEDGTRRINERIVGRSVEDAVTRGNKLRTDTTVTESNIHHPTDSTLLADGIRVLTRTLGRIASQCKPGTLKVVDHALATKRRVLEIYRAAKVVRESGREKLEEGYRKLLGVARSVARQAETVKESLAGGTLNLARDASITYLTSMEAQLRHFAPLVKGVIAQTEARVFGGDNHFEGKILSLFEEHTVAIRKGKAHKPTEFGRLVRIDEVEGGIISHYEVHDGNPADQGGLIPAIDQHQKTFGRVPRIITADRGFHSAANIRAAEQRGVTRVAVPGRGRLSGSQAARQKQRWFQRALRWRTGIESRIATLKNRFGMLRAFYKGDRGFKRHIGWSVIAQNLVSIARAKARRASKNAKRKQAA